MGRPSIRRARLDDIAAIIPLVAELARVHGDVATTDTGTLAADAFGPRPWVDILVADIAGAIVGYAALLPLYQAQFGRRGADLHHLVVRQDWRGQGVGRELAMASIAAAREMGCRFVVVGTHPANVEAQRFYRHIGFDEAPPPGPRFRLRLAG